MKNKILIFIVLIGLTILNFSCQKDDEVLNEQTQTQSIILETTSLSKTRHSINLKDFFKSTEGVKTNNGALLGRSSEAFFNDFVVDTSSVKYIEGPVSHSYTFALTPNYNNPTLVQNLLLAKHDNMDSYLALLVTYNLTQNELELIENGVYPSNFTNQPTFEKIDDLDPNILGIAARICIEFTTTYTYEFPCTCCAVHADPSCNHPDVVSITVSEVGACSGAEDIGSGSSGDDGSSSGGGGGGIDWGGSEYSPYDPNDVENSGNLLAEGPLTQINVPARSLVREQMSNLLDNQDVNFINNYPDLESAFNSFLRGNSDTFRYDFIDWSIDYLQYLYISSHSQVPGIPPTSPENAVIFDSIVNNPSSEIIEALENALSEEWLNKYGDAIFFDPPQVSSVITDLDDYFDCFTVDPNSTYKVTIYVDQPIPGSREPYVDAEGNTKITADKETIEVGHTFVQFSQLTNGLTSESKIAGLYPENGVSPDSPSDSPEYINDENHPYDVALQITVDSTDFFNMIDEFKTVEDYDINENNCTDQGLDCLSAGGIDLPDTQGSWFLGNGGGSNPADLGEDIREMELSPNMTRFTNPGTAPSNTNSGC